MQKIDWIKVAKDSNLTTEEFVEQIYSTACCVGVMEIEQKNGDSLVYTCNDGVGEIRMTISRVTQRNLQ